jgi:hypothetical protein
MRYTRSDLEKLAGHTVNLAISSGDSLVDTVLSVLRSNPMNPEQVRRLSEMANTEMFLQKFKGTSGDDRFVDFDVVDPSEIIKKYLGEDAKPAFSSSKSLTVTVSSGPEGTSVTKKVKQDPGLDTEDSRFYEDITPSNLSDLDSGSFLEGDSASGAEEKTASEEQVSTKDAFKVASQILKVKESLEDKVAHCNYRCEDLASKLSSKFKGIYSREKHSSFEKEALANFGSSSLPVLQAVRSKLAMPLLQGSVSEEAIKTASDRYVSDRASEGMKEASEYIDTVAEYKAAAYALSKLEKTAAGAYNLFGLVPTGDTASGISYQLSRRFIPLSDRVRAIDESAKSFLNYGLRKAQDNIDDYLDDREDSKKMQALKELRKKTIREMILTNPDMKSSGKKNVMTAVNTLSKLAPELSTDLPFLTAHVRQMLHNNPGGVPGLDAQSISAITKAEKSFTSLGDTSNPYR